MHTRLKLGMVGGGRGAFIGAVHRMAARLDDQFELVAGAMSSDARRAAQSAADVGIASHRSYADWQEMALAEGEMRRNGQGGIDAVSIVTPNHLHAAIAKAFLAQGIHVICDKPLAVSLDQALELRTLARQSGLIFVLTHTYTGYPMVRHARNLVAHGDIGELRLIQVEYAQDWWADVAAQDDTNWRGNPQVAGPAGTLGDVGTHAYQLACYVSGVQPIQIAADMNTFVEGRQLDDHVQVMMRYANGARGTLWASQVATGCENALTLRVYGTRAQLSFRQESPNELWFTPQAGEPRKLTPGRATSVAQPVRIPAGHPEGYIEAFARLYSDAADQIRMHGTVGGAAMNTAIDSGVLPGLDDGVAGHRFIDAVLSSHRQNSAWVCLETSND